MVLPRLTVLDGRYAIGRVLDAPEPLVVEYQAWNLHNEDQVVVEEFFPSSLVRRAAGSFEVEAFNEIWDELFHYGLQQYLKETEVLASINHPNLMPVTEFFKANGTAYRVLEHHKGATLDSVMAKQSGKLPLKTAFTILFPLLDGLQAVHQEGLIHGAFSPKAIFLAKGRGPMLMGFRTTHVMLAQRMGDLEILVEDGVSAPEQYQPDGKQGPWTDVYGSAATFFQMLTGRTLPAAPQRMEKDMLAEALKKSTELPVAVRNLLQRALAMDSAQRPRSAHSFRQELMDAVQDKASTEAMVSVAKPAAPDEKAEEQELDPVVLEAEELAAAVVEKVAVTSKDKADVVPEEEPEAVEAEPEAAVEEAEPEAFEEEAEADVEEEPEAVEEAEPELLEDEPERLEDEIEEEPVEDEYDYEPAVEETVAYEVEDEPVDIELSEPEVEEEPVAFEAPEVYEEEYAPVAETPLVGREEVEDEAAQEMAAQAARAQTEETPSTQDSSLRRRDRRSMASVRADRSALRSQRRGGPVLAALAVVVLVALVGAYVLMQGDGNELTQFAHYKAQGDSLFAMANYVEAKTQYEYALEAAPNNEYISNRLNETQQRLDEVADVRYDEQIARGDSLYAAADASLRKGDATQALGAFVEANRAYLEALQYRPDDASAIEKGEQTSQKMDEAIRRSQEQAGKNNNEENPEALREQLYNSYRQQGDQLFQREDYTTARERYRKALGERPGDAYATAKIDEIDLLLENAQQDERFAQLIQQATQFSEQGQYDQAKSVYEQALQVKPGNQQALNGLNIVNNALANAQRDAQYQQFRNQGDTQMRNNQNTEALTSYEQALTFKPGDEYVQGKIRELRQAAAQNKITGQESAASETNVPEGGVYSVVDEPPELIGGLGSLHSKVGYPQQARIDGIEGRVYIQFVVTEEGRVEDARVIRGIGGGCDEEALRVVKDARFVPGKFKGKPVKVRHTLFITFRLQQ